ncbi:MAG TPA: Mur ligase family protein [Candidatus Humimicrobiaceae bacterium]|nr:Mur ligase family protein [Candidatus Humimicrobiaceae bacterium]
MLNKLKNKKILIFGFGKEGKDAFLFLRKLFPKKVIGIADKSDKIRRLDKKVRLYLGKNYLKSLKNYDVIIKSPGIPFKILPKSAFKKITTPTAIFLENCPGKIVGVTGTKGKSTTTSLIYKILKDGGLKAHLVGNIGKPVLNLLFSAKKNNIYVYELSSHQLYGLKKSPQIAVFLNIYPEHLDYYRNFREYANAKANITRYQTKNDYLVFNSRDKLVREFAKKSKANKIPIRGVYHDLNKNAARAVGKIFKIPKKAVEKAIRDFKPLPHRLEYVGTFKGIKFYNDALSTIPEATIAALNILSGKVETILLGGFDRGLDFRNLAKAILKDEIKNLILFPTTGENIWREIFKQVKNDFSKLPRAFLVQNMKDAVKLAYEHTPRGKICLLSTASASFSIFKDYKEKGNLFKKYIKLYGKKT